MIAYHGPYNSKLGRSPVLGQDAIIEPFEPTPGELPTPEPFGGPNTVVTLPPTGTTPAQAAAPAPVPIPVVQTPPAKPGWMVKIGGKSISGWTLVLASSVIVGGIALVAYTKEDIDMFYAKKGKKK